MSGGVIFAQASFSSLSDVSKKKIKNFPIRSQSDLLRKLSLISNPKQNTVSLLSSIHLFNLGVGQTEICQWHWQIDTRDKDVW